MGVCVVGKGVVGIGRCVLVCGKGMGWGVCVSARCVALRGGGSRWSRSSMSSLQLLISLCCVCVVVVYRKVPEGDVCECAVWLCVGLFGGDA